MERKIAKQLLKTGIIASIIGGIVGFVIICQAIITRGASLAGAPYLEPFVLLYFVDMTMLVAANAVEARGI